MDDMAKEKYVNRFRRIQTVVSIALFVFLFLFFWWSTKSNLSDIQLSYWGLDKRFGMVWNISVMLVSVSIFINAAFYLKRNARLNHVKPFYCMFGLTSLCLFLVGLVKMHHLLHDAAAYTYFFSYPMSVFLMAHWNRKCLPYKEWRGHVILSACMVVFPAVLLHFFRGLAISESTHIFIVMVWNSWLLSMM